MPYRNERVVDMDDKTVWILVNLDLEKSVFTTFSAQVGSLSGLRGVFRDLHDLTSVVPQGPEAKLGVIVFFNRRIDPALPSVRPALDALDQSVQSLERAQIKQSIRRAVLVDCSEMPNAPLSDFNVLGQYFEAISDLLPLPEGALVAALDFRYAPSGGIVDTVWWDTRSQKFVDHMRDHIVESLGLLNGTGPDSELRTETGK